MHSVIWSMSGCSVCVSLVNRGIPCDVLPLPSSVACARVRAVCECVSVNGSSCARERHRAPAPSSTGGAVPTPRKKTSSPSAKFEVFTHLNWLIFEFRTPHVNDGRGTLETLEESVVSFWNKQTKKKKNQLAKWTPSERPTEDPGEYRGRARCSPRGTTAKEVRRAKHAAR